MNVYVHGLIVCLSCTLSCCRERILAHKKAISAIKSRIGGPIKSPPSGGKPGQDGGAEGDEQEGSALGENGENAAADNDDSQQQQQHVTFLDDNNSSSPPPELKSPDPGNKK